MIHYILHITTFCATTKAELSKDSEKYYLVLYRKKLADPCLRPSLLLVTVMILCQPCMQFLLNLIISMVSRGIFLKYGLVKYHSHSVKYLHNKVQFSHHSLQDLSQTFPLQKQLSFTNTVCTTFILKFSEFSIHPLLQYNSLPLWVHLICHLTNRYS